MIRCSECDRCKGVSFDYGRKVFYFCAEMGYPKQSISYTVKLWSKKPKAHPRWCPRYKEVKKDVESRPVYADPTVGGSIFWMP